MTAAEWRYITLTKITRVVLAAADTRHSLGGSAEGKRAMTQENNGRENNGREKGNRTMAQESKDLTTHDTEVENIQIAAQEDAGFERILKFKKGDFIGDEDVPIGTEYVAHVRAWGKCWIKFVDGQVAERTWLRGYSAGHLLESALSSYGWLRGRAGVTERAEIAKDCAAVRTSAIRSAFDNRPPRIRSAVSMAVVCLSRATATRRGRGATAIS
jgi:hypothetical protein